MRVKKIFSQVYRDPDVCDFVWYMASTGLDRRQVTGKMLFILGSGANGKTATMNFIQNAIGLNLCASIKMALLTGQSGKANEADSAFMQAKGKTLVIFDEGSGSDVLNSEKVKNIINNNAQSGRDLYGLQENFWLHCCAFNTSNHEPIIRSSDTDHGFWRRVYFTQAKSKFTENPDPNKPHEHDIDPEIESKLTSDPLHLNAVLSIMTYYYEKLMTDYGGNLNHVPCDTIKEETRKFRKDQDKSFRYCYERIIISPIYTIGASELGEDYSNWAVKQFKDSINASKAENYLSTSALGDFKSGFDYVGIRMKSYGPVNKAKHELTFAEYTSMDDKERREYNEKAAAIRIEADRQRESADNEDEEGK
jgi:phage/plasmid-associated DNA primase